MDPVRYLSNPSSGQMGLVLADELKKSGAHPVVILGPTPLRSPVRVPTMRVVTAREMHRAVLKRISQADVFIATAAVCDFRFARPASQKIKKGNQTNWQVRLVKNPDILREVGERREKSGTPRPLLIGFALETKNLRPAMRNKLREKNLDLIVGNSPASFESYSIEATFLDRGGRWTRFPRVSKRQLARKIITWIEQNSINS